MPSSGVHVRCVFAVYARRVGGVWALCVLRVSVGYVEDGWRLVHDGWILGQCWKRASLWP